MFVNFDYKPPPIVKAGVVIIDVRKENQQPLL